MVHFTLFRDIIRERLGLSETKYIYDYTYQICCRYFIPHLVLAKTMLPVEEILPQHLFTWSWDLELPESPIPSDWFPTCPSLSWTSTENLALVMDEDRLDQIDPYSGLSNGLLLLINDIADLQREAHQMAKNNDFSFVTAQEASMDLMFRIERLALSLCNLSQDVSICVALSDPEVAEDLRQTAEAGRLAALMLLNEIIHSTSRLCHEGIPTPQSDGRASLKFGLEHKTVYSQRIFDLVGDLLERSTTLNVSWPLWPLFIAGSSADTDQRRLVAIQLFEMAMQKSTTLGVRFPLLALFKNWNS